MQRGRIKLERISGGQLYDLGAVAIGDSTTDHVYELYAGMLEGDIGLSIGQKRDQVRFYEQVP
ncbi:hypothetical protein A9977_27800 [Variovorax sp. UMC13]|nr:hypothetical protein [Variovorax sp. UMC13]